MSRKRGRNKIFQKLLNGTLTDADLLASGHLTDIHHRKSRGQGGNNKKSNKNKVYALDHRIWHYFTKNSTLDELADKISNDFVSRDSRFFVITKDRLGNSLYKTVQKMNQWLGDGDLKIKVVFKRSKIIQFRPWKQSELSEQSS